MGQYSSVEITAVFNSKESASKAKEQVKKLDDYLKNKLGNEDFSTSVFSIDSNDKELNIGLDSGRYENAKWQSKQILEMLKESFIDSLISFSAEISAPENIIYYEKEAE